MEHRIQDIFEAVVQDTPDRNKVIAQQVNCLGIAGGGIAAEIRHRYDGWFEQYKAFCDRYSKSRSMLGMAQYICVGDRLWIANLFGQYQVGTSEKQTDDEALEKGLIDLAHWSQLNQATIYIPHKIGCGLGGGDWETVSNLIKVHCPEAIVCQRPARKSYRSFN